MSLLAVEEVTRSFSQRRWFAPPRVLRAVDGVSFELQAGRTLGLVGESGSGKSTVGRMALGLLEPTSGRVLLNGAPLAERGTEAWRNERRQLQLIVQDPSSALNPRLTVGAIVREALELHSPVAEHDTPIASLLSSVGLRPEWAQRLPNALSGGQKQRLVIARALAVGPSVLVADEPVSALDVSVQAQVVNLLRDVQAERGLAMLFITHDLRVVRQVADEIAVMYLGRIIEKAGAEQLLSRPQHPYSQALISAVPTPGQRERIVLSGEPPSPFAPPSGCAFHPRCPRLAGLDAAQRQRCRDESPTLVLMSEGRVACHFPG